MIVYSQEQKYMTIDIIDDGDEIVVERCYIGD